MSLFANWLDAKWRALSTSDDIDPGLVAQVALLSRRSPGYAALLDGWRPTTREGINDPFRFARDLPAIHEDALGHLGFDRLATLAESRGIPIINQYDYITRQGARPRDAIWVHDGHLNAAGHRWAAEALFEYLKRNQAICTRRKHPASPQPSPSWLTDYESIASGEPAARSVFDVYAGENTVAYLKSPCGAADVQAEFFLHIVPEDSADLPADRRQYGFGGANFRYGNTAALDFGGRCIAKYPLPDYPIARIRTGQFTPAGDQIWMAEFPVGAAEGEPPP